MELCTLEAADITYAPRNIMLALLCRHPQREEAGQQIDQLVGRIRQDLQQAQAEIEPVRFAYYLEQALPWSITACNILADTVCEQMASGELEQDPEKIAAALCRVELPALGCHSPVPCIVRVHDAGEGPVIDIIPADEEISKALGIDAPLDPDHGDDVSPL